MLALIPRVIHKKYFSNVYNLQYFFSFWWLRSLTRTRGSAPGPRYVPPCPFKIGPPIFKNSAPPLKCSKASEQCL